jgi:transposase
MRPRAWQPPIPLSPTEAGVVRRVRRAKLFVFLREHRHELFDDAFQAELAALYKDSPLGQPPVPPAQLALATLLQAYVGCSDDEAIEATMTDRRWQLVLDCLDAEEAPFGKGTLVAFRQRLIAADLDRRLIERTVDLAAARGGFGPRPLRAALDSSPLWGAGRVEDTYNLLGHALRKAVGVVARQQGRELAAVAGEAGAGLVAGSSLKAALDLDWDDPAAAAAGLGRVLAALDAVEAWLVRQTDPPDAAPTALAIAQEIRAQDVVVSMAEPARLRQGVASARRISVEDGEMRHGRKSRSRLFDGFKRHALRDLDRGVVRAVGITPGNVPEAEVTDDIATDLARQAVRLAELHIDRAYLSSRLVRERPADLRIYCKAWPVREGPCFAKSAFTLDWAAQTIRCPGGEVVPFACGETVRFPAETCAACPLRERCTTSAAGRSVSIHPDERLLLEVRARQQTPAGRAELRERVAVEHSLAHLGHWQGDRARYRGVRKNLFDLRRCAVIHNLHVIARLPEPDPAPIDQAAAA